MDSLYDPSGVERRWQQTWEAEGLYAAGAGRRRDDTFVICIPPPNVTGELHMGHALNGAMQDVLIRWHRMQGFDALWQPGYDHAGISTQNVVEKQLVAEGTSRREIGREAFVARTWDWLERTGRTIMGQYRRLGASVDYSRERFTMDDEYVRAVMTFFVRLWERGWIYRANRIVNWCPYHETAISDLEVEHVEKDDMLYRIVYPFAEGGGGLTIATVRPSTLLARHGRGCPSRRPALRGRRRPRGDRARGRAASAHRRGRAASTRSSARARSRSPRDTTRWTSRSAATTSFQR